MTIARTLVLIAVAAFVVANLIHNGGLLDPAAFPALTFAGLLLWRPRPIFLFAAALFVAVPAVSFLNWTALADVSHLRPFFNHVALLVAGVFATVGAAAGGVRTARR